MIGKKEKKKNQRNYTLFLSSMSFLVGLFADNQRSSSLSYLIGFILLIVAGVLTIVINKDEE